MTIASILFQLFLVFLFFNVKYRIVSDNIEVLCVPQGGVRTIQTHTFFAINTPSPSREGTRHFWRAWCAHTDSGSSTRSPPSPHGCVASGDSCPCFTARDITTYNVAASSHKKACYLRKRMWGGLAWCPEKHRQGQEAEPGAKTTHGRFRGGRGEPGSGQDTEQPADGGGPASSLPLWGSVLWALGLDICGASRIRVCWDEGLYTLELGLGSNVPLTEG